VVPFCLNFSIIEAARWEGGRNGVASCRRCASFNPLITWARHAKNLIVVHVSCSRWCSWISRPKKKAESPR
jgi:hypothetical protein